MIGNEIDYDEIFKISTIKYLKEFNSWYSPLKKKGVSVEILLGELIEKHIELHGTIFTEVESYLGYGLNYSDPFMAKILEEFERLLRLKHEKPVNKIIAMREAITKETGGMRWYGKEEFINKSNEALIDAIAEYRFNNSMIAILTANIKPKKKKNQSINYYHLDPKSLKDLGDVLDALKNGKMISESVSLPTFKKAFTGGLKTGNKIEWAGSVPALHIFIDGICKKCSQKVKGKWDIAFNFFNKADADLKNLSNNKTGATKADKEIIEKALNLIPAPSPTTK